MSTLTEAQVEAAAIELFAGQGFATPTNIEGVHDEREAGGGQLLCRRLRESLRRLNPTLSEETVGDVARIVGNPPHPTLVENNRWFHTLLTDGAEVEYKDPQTGETRGGRGRLMDFDNPANNDYLVVRQLTVQGANGKLIRPDLIVYVNGLPLAVIELKDPTNPEADHDAAIDQFGRYVQTAPDLFVPNLLLVASDGLLTRVGSITSGRSRFMPWRPAGGGEPTLEALIRGLFQPAALLDYLRSCVVFEQDERGNIAKKVAGYHQFRAVRQARALVLAALKPPAGVNTTADAGKGGVVWHTQGSGKSLTMLMLAGALIREPALANPTIVMVTDRNDLDDQLFGTFAAGRALLRQAPIQAESRADLRAYLDRASGGVIFTTIYKFTEEHGRLSDRANVVVMADEAHRSQYGFTEVGAPWMREALPNATFVGFTGTPLDNNDRSTLRVFGPYADVYDIRQAVEDGATKPIYYESRIIKLTVNEAGAEQAEKEIRAAAQATREGVEAEENVRVPLEAVVGAPERVGRVAAFIVEHWEKRRAAMEGKAMVVTMSRDIAARLYEAIRALRPDWHNPDDDKGAMKVVVTGGPDDEEPLASHVRSKAKWSRRCRSWIGRSASRSARTCGARSAACSRYMATRPIYPRTRPNLC